MSAPNPADPLDRVDATADVDPADVDPAVDAPAGVPVRPPLPIAVYVLAALLLVKAILIGVVVLGASIDPLRVIASSTVTYQLIAPLLTNPVVTGFVVLVAVALAFAAIALLRRRRIGWLLAMVLTGVFVAIDIYGYLTTGANHLWMAINIITVFYLNQAEVRQTVGAAEPDGEPVRVVTA
jgi:hypothetical protein